MEIERKEKKLSVRNEQNIRPYDLSIEEKSKESDIKAQKLCCHHSCVGKTSNSD